MTSSLAPAIRRLTLADLPVCLDLAADRGWSREEHKWRLLLTAGQGYGVDAPSDDPSPESSGPGRYPHGGLLGVFVLTSYGPSNGTLAGTSSDTPGGVACTCISMVLVAERHARRGLGRRLMLHALEESGDATVFLSATDQGRPLYEKLGFEPVGTSVILTGVFSGPSASAGVEAAGVPVRDATAADLPAILALDAPVFGADRTHLLARLPSFADHLVVAPSRSGASRTGTVGAGDAGTGITGFAAAWPNEGTTVLGPVVAEDLPTARALIAELASRTDGPVRFDADTRHRELVSWLRSHGLDGDFTCTLMVRGAPDIPGDIGRRFAPYSVALG